MVFNILLLVLVVGVLADIGITVLLLVKFHSMLGFATWLDVRALARKAWVASGVLMLFLRAFGVI